MRRIIVALALISVGFTSFAEQKRALFPAPFMLSEGQELPRSEFISYLKKDQAFAGVRDSSAYFVDLNGYWRYREYATAAELPKEVGMNEGVLERFVAHWDTVPVPGNPSGLQEDETLRPVSAVGVFVRKFTIPFELFDKAHFLRIGAVGSAVTVYVNGHNVGFSQGDTKNPVEFDVTNYVSEGRNWVALVVPQLSAASFLDGAQALGIERDVCLIAQPKIRMRDYLVRTTLDPTYTNGFLETAMLLKTQLLNANPVTVYYDLYDPGGKLVNNAFREVEVGLKTEDTIRFTASVPNVIKWTAETPNLYTILYRIQREGRFTEYVACKVGFREVKIAGRELLVNGVRAKINGINVTEELMAGGMSSAKEKMEELKYLGVNSLRTQCPMPENFYALCDEMGFYVCDVANIHTSWQANSRYKGGNVTNNPVWKGAYWTRVDNMYERNKNHPSVIMWATGELSSNGYNMYQAYLGLKAKEDTRPIVYDGARMEWNTDMYMPMYGGSRTNYREEQAMPRSADRKDDYRLADRPYIPSWFVSDVVEGRRVPEGAQGVFLAVGTEAGKISALFATIDIERVDEERGIYRFTNNQDFKTDGGITIEYSVFNGKKTVKTGRVQVTAEPGESQEILVPGGGVAGNSGWAVIFKAAGTFKRFD